MDTLTKEDYETLHRLIIQHKHACEHAIDGCWHDEILEPVLADYRDKARALRNKLDRIICQMYITK